MYDLKICQPSPLDVLPLLGGEGGGRGGADGGGASHVGAGRVVLNYSCIHIVLVTFGGNNMKSLQDKILVFMIFWGRNKSFCNIQ